MAKTEQGNGLDLRGSTEKLTENGKGNSYGSDPEVNGSTVPGEKQVDKYGFTGGAQQSVGNFAEEIPTEVLRQREAKWLEMLNSWDKWMAKKHKKVKERCQKGIPPSLRGRAWLYLTGGKVKREQNLGKFKELDSQPGDPKWIDIIERDLHRQFPFHEMFAARGGHGQQDLLSVLKAYTLYRPEEGYCQAQAPIAAVLLMHMPAEDAFWVLVQICEKYLPGYYSTGLEAIQLDGEILYALLRRVSPVAHSHLKKHKLEPILYMTEWFMCAFSRTLPWASVLRVWDMFLCEGVKIIFRVGLVLLKCMLGSQDKLKSCQGLYETMELLRAIQPQYMQEGFLAQQIVELQVSEKDIEKEHHSQLRRWKESHGDLHCKSPPRMHGAKAIIAADPPSRQDLRQRPTIIVHSPEGFKTDGERAEYIKKNRKTKQEKEKNTNLPPQEIVNPYLPHSEPSPLLKQMTREEGSKESLSSAEHDTYL
uniref:TBC1 domain family member 10A n=1 Tax=Scatophagus argus TaxID=75038 RepID=UPI001ED7DE7C|nr:TBC1 domain family member 10A [Scatophagus argus]